MIYLLCSTIAPDTFKVTHKEWMDKVSNPDNVTTKVVVDTNADRDQLDGFDVTVYNGPSLGITKPLTRLTQSLKGLNDSDIVIVMSDDFFPPNDWDIYLTKQYEGFTGGLCVNDGSGRKNMKGIISIPIIDFATLKKLNGIVYHPAYTHLWSDNELSDNLQELNLLKVVKMDGTFIFEHRHWTKNKRLINTHDQILHTKNDKDKEIYYKRKKLSIEEKINYSSKVFSILICSLASRQKSLDELLAVLRPQLYNDIEVIVGSDNGQMTIGEKRNWLLDRAVGDYIAFIDDDDLVSSDYVSSILTAIYNNLDVVGFEGEITTNGHYPKVFKHSILYKKWETVGGVYLRNPNHLNPVKRSIAIKVRFNPKSSHGEDACYSKRLLPHLQSEAYIKKKLYLYKFITCVKKMN